MNESEAVIEIRRLIESSSWFLDENSLNFAFRYVDNDELEIAFEFIMTEIMCSSISIDTHLKKVCLRIADILNVSNYEGFYDDEFWTKLESWLNRNSGNQSQ